MGRPATLGALWQAPNHRVTTEMLAVEGLRSSLQ
jgi:hypothetical protein